MKLVLLVVILFSGKDAESLMHVLSNVTNSSTLCTRLYSVRMSHYEPYIETYRNAYPISHAYRIQTRLNYRREFQTIWKTKYECCDGYMNVRGTCIPQCDFDCQFGFCYEPNICHCYSGYAKSQSKPEHVCVPVCEHECIQGTCTSPHICTCYTGYKLESDGYTCSPECNETCSETEYCAGPNDCQCIPGYERRAQEPTVKVLNNVIMGNTSALNEVVADRTTISTLTQHFTPLYPRSRCVPVCDQPCINGDCISPNVCECYKGYIKVEDEAFTCVPYCEHPCEFGNCTAPNTCTCDPGYGLVPVDDDWVCRPICSEPCINGICVAPENCSCFDGYSLLDDGNTTFCAAKCNNGCLNGRCVAPDTCECHPEDVLTTREEGNSRYNICVHSCPNCVNGNCFPREEACKCFYGWNGDNCDEPFLCILESSEIDSNQVNLIYDNDISAKSLHVPRNLPNCSEKCISEINNGTECYLSPRDNQSNVTICFMSAVLDCNAVEKGYQKASVAPMAIGIILLVLGAISIGTILLIRRQKGINRRNRFDIQSENAHHRQATDCLLDDEGNL